MDSPRGTPGIVNSVLPSPDRLHLRLFGGIDLRSNNVPLPRTRTRTEMWLLAVLILRANRNVERSWLAGIFWPESREAQARNNLRRSLSNLRQVLGDKAYRLLTPTQHTIAFDLTDAFCDVIAFDSALAHKDNESLRYAVELYRGPLLPECDADWVLSERSTREQAYLNALETLVAQAMQNGDAQEAIRFLRQILHVDPFRETTQRTLLEALASQGDKAGMTLAYRQLRLRLHDEMQAELSAETKALYQCLQERLQERVSRNPSTVSPERPTPLPLHIPWPISSLIGREKEIKEVTSLLRTHRLITLTGSGGIGKTRLALAVAAQVARSFPDGVWFVDLSTITDPAQVLPIVARALELREQKGHPSPAGALREYLQGKTLLLILDNAEHLLESCAMLTNALLESLPELHVLVTSRMRLCVAGEQVWRVPSLSFPDQSPAASVPFSDVLLDYAGPRLFVTRALSASSDFTLTEKNAPAIVHICSRLDGIPLALELAAARMANLSAEQIAVRLEDVFRLLTTGIRTALPRHQTLRALIDWSYDLLSKSEKILLSRLSVFAGGWTLEAAETIGADTDTQHPISPSEILDLLSSLVDKSLVLAEESDGTKRYRMLETLRQYGAQKLNTSGETVRVQGRLREYFVAFVEKAGPHLLGPEAKSWLMRLETEHNNLRAVLDECVTETEDAKHAQAKGEAGLRLVGVLWRFWQMRGYFSEGRQQIARVLERSQTRVQAPKLRATVLVGAGNLAYWQGDYTASRLLYEESLTLYRDIGDKRTVALLLGYLGNIASAQGDYAMARSLLEEGLALLREIGERSSIVGALINVGAVTHAQGDYAAAWQLYNESLALGRELGDNHAASQSHNNLGMVAMEQGNYALARAQFEASLVLKRELGDRRGIANTLINLGNVAKAYGDYTAARLLYTESLVLCRDLGLRYYTTYCFEGLAAVCLGEKDTVKAVVLFGAANALRESLGTPPSATEQTEHDMGINQAREVLSTASGDENFSTLWEQGRALRLERAIDYALNDAGTAALLRG